MINCYVLLTILLITLLLLEIFNIYYYYLKNRSKTKRHYHITNWRWIERMNNASKEIDIDLEEIDYYFDDIIKINDLDLDNILLDEYSYENILIYDVAFKTRYHAKRFRIIFDKLDGYIRKCDGTKSAF